MHKTLLTLFSGLALWSATLGCGSPGEDEGPAKKRIYVRCSLLNEVWTPPPWHHRNDGHWPTWWFVYDRLVENNLDFEAEYPNLARSWDISQDRLQYTFHLRDDVRWHDGKPFTAYDVETTFLYGMDRYLPAAGYRDQFLAVEGTPEYRAHEAEGISGLKVIDLYTIQFNLAYPAPFFMWAIGNLTILPKHQLEIAGESSKVEGLKTWRDPGAAGTGPFKLVETAPFQFVRLERYDDYHLGTPLIDEVIIHDKDIALSASNFELDLGDNATPQQAAEIAAMPHMTILPGRSIHLTSLQVNVSDPALADRRVRRALMHAIDRKTIAETTFGAYADITVPQGVVPDIAWRNEKLRPIDYDPERARELLAAANFDMQTELMINLRDIDMAGIRLDIATIVQGYWTQIGLNAKVEAVEGAIMSERLLKGEFMTYVGGTGSVVPTPLLRFRTGCPSPTAFGYSNPRVDATIAQIDTTFDPEALRLLYDRLQEYVWEDVAVMPILNTIPLLARSKRLKTGALTPNNNHPVGTWWHLWDLVE